VTLQEVLIDAMKRPISDIGKIIIEREGQRGTCGAFFLAVDEEQRLIVRDWESDLDCRIAKLYLDDILATDWIVAEYTA
jgi:hypothetical protein